MRWGRLFLLFFFFLRFLPSEPPPPGNQFTQAAPLSPLPPISDTSKASLPMTHREREEGTDWPSSPNTKSPNRAVTALGVGFGLAFFAEAGCARGEQTGLQETEAEVQDGWEGREK